jgi:hypothetical protein
MQNLMVNLPDFIGACSLGLMDQIFGQIEERINIAAAYQRFCWQKLTEPELSSIATFKYQLMLDWACAEMDMAYANAQKICELTGQSLRVRHVHAARRWVLEVTR